MVEAEFLAAARGRWNAAKPALEAEWREYERAHPAVADVSATLDDAAITNLVGLEHRRKGQDRIMEKVARQTEAQADLTPEEAVASVKDAMVELRNSWKHEEYKGINSRWLIAETGQLFEVQFHTRISFEAKQLSHQAYERLRIPAAPKMERDELKDFQRRVSGNVPVPHGALNYADYP